VTATGYASEFFSIPKMKMSRVSAASVSAGTDPTFTQVNRVFLGEADTSGAAVTAVRSYAYRGRAENIPVTTAAGSPTFNHNLGVTPRVCKVTFVNQIAEAGYKPGDEMESMTAVNTTPSATGISALHKPNQSVVLLCSGGLYYINTSSTVVTAGMTYGNWKTRINVQRGW
jgi:hypothetical protein